MCRGANLGPCIAEDCDKPIRCRDNGAFCDEHADNFDLCYCDGDCVCPPSKPRPAVNETKRLDHALARSFEGIQSLEARLADTLKRLTAAKIRRDELLQQRASLPVSAPVGGGQRDD